MFAGFDLGGTTGFAVLERTGNRIHSEIWKIGASGDGKSLCVFQNKLHDLLIIYGVVAVGYELVVPNQQRSRIATAAYSRYEGILLAICHSIGLPLHGFRTHEVKKHAVGFVQAEKDDMEASAFKRWNVLVKTHDEADALWVADLTRLLHQ